MEVEDDDVGQPPVTSPDVGQPPVTSPAVSSFEHIDAEVSFRRSQSAKEKAGEEENEEVADEEESEELLRSSHEDDDFATLLRRSQRPTKDIFRKSGKFRSFAQSPGSVANTPHGNRTPHGSRKQTSPRKLVRDPFSFRAEEDDEDDDWNAPFTSTPANVYGPSPCIPDHVVDGAIAESDDNSEHSFVFGSREVKAQGPQADPRGGDDSHLERLFDRTLDSGLNTQTQ